MNVVCRLLRSYLPFHPLLRCLNSTEAFKLSQLSLEAQRALWANHFINTIIKQPMTTSIESPSLREKLINSPNPIPEYIFDQAIKKQMTGIFTKGAYFDPTVFQQIRITRARKQNAKLAFYPSVLVTTKIFAQLHYSRQRMMFQGSYGIGKTISIVFYIYLSNIINKYALLAANSKNEEFLKEYEYLVEKVHLPRENVKYWYWSMDWDLVQYQDFSLSIILAEQATELTKLEREQIRKCKTVEEAQKKIRQLYKQANIMHMAVLDQVNHAVSFIRNWSQFVQSNKDLIDRANSKRADDIGKRYIKKMYQPTTQLISLAQRFTAMNPVYYVLNSAINLESEQIEQKDIDFWYYCSQEERNQYAKTYYQPLTLGLKFTNRKTSPMEIVLFPFQKEIKTQSGKIHFWRFFLDLLEEKAHNLKLTEQGWVQFKNAFLKYACSLDLKSYYQFFQIKLFLQVYGYVDWQFIRGRDTDTAIKRIIYDFERLHLSEIGYKFYLFTKRGDTELKKHILKKIYKLALIQKQRNGENLQINLRQMEQMLYDKQNKPELPLYFIFLQSQQTNQIPIYSISPSQMVIQWSPQEYIAITKQTLISKDKVSLKEFLRNGQRLRELLSKCSEVTFKSVTAQKKSTGGTRKMRTRLKFQRHKYLIYGQTNFIQFVEGLTSSSYTLQQHFEKAIFYCKQYPERWILCLPVRAQGEEDRFMPDGSTIDLAFVKCTLDTNTERFIIHTYDNTIGSSSVAFRQKKTMNLILKKADGLSQNIKIRHHILCPIKECIDVLRVNQNIKICCSDVKGMKTIY